MVVMVRIGNIVITLQHLHTQWSVPGLSLCSLRGRINSGDVEVILEVMNSPGIL